MKNDLDVETIKISLQQKQRQVIDQLKSIQIDDPILADVSSESSELGSDSWEADVHMKMLLVKDNLLKISKNIKLSLEKLKSGTYGMCSKCGKEIEAERLLALPTADRCIVCK